MSSCCGGVPCPHGQVLGFPVGMLVRFWVNHHLLDLVQRPCWRVVKGRSATYVAKVLASLSHVHTGAAVVSVQRAEAPGQLVVVKTSCGQQRQFDAVVLATHSDTALAILGNNATEVSSGRRQH